MAETCQGECTSTCVLTCSNLCDNVCRYLCNNHCTSSCETMCGSDCDTSCIGICKSSSMSTSEIRTYLDRASMRKVSALLTPEKNGLYIYPGLNGKFTVHRITDEHIKERLSVALYNQKVHANGPRTTAPTISTEDDEYVEVTERFIPGPKNESEWEHLFYDDLIPIQYKPYGGYSIEEIQKVLFDVLIRALPNIGDLEADERINEFLTYEDILYIVYHDPKIYSLYIDIQNWSWNNSDTISYKLIKKTKEVAQED